MHPGGAWGAIASPPPSAFAGAATCSSWPALRAFNSCLVPSWTQLRTLELRCSCPLLLLLQNLPFYRIFAADARCPRDGRHLEQLGHYDPIPGEQHCCASQLAWLLLVAAAW